VRLEDADEELMGSVGGIAIVRKIPVQAVARDITMHERARCAARLEPVDALKVAEPDVSSPPPVPITLHRNQERVICLHRLLPSTFLLQ
jgi:hypothetical protein